MNNIQNDKLIPLDNTYYMGLADTLGKRLSHPLNDYYYKVSDLSINIYGSLKWAIWGYKFLKSISSDLNILYEETLISGIKFNPVPFSINSPLEFPPQSTHLLLLDDIAIVNEGHFYTLINNEYNAAYFDKNSKIHWKLKINLNEFLILQSELTPIMTKMQEL